MCWVFFSREPLVAPCMDSLVTVKYEFFDVTLSISNNVLIDLSLLSAPYVNFEFIFCLIFCYCSYSYCGFLAYMYIFISLCSAPLPRQSSSHRSPLSVSLITFHYPSLFVLSPVPILSLPLPSLLVPPHVPTHSTLSIFSLSVRF